MRCTVGMFTQKKGIISESEYPPVKQYPGHICNKIYTDTVSLGVKTFRIKFAEK